ncbi:MAG: hypothetical protein V4521_06745, partial [Pseudomonadota bacterium]
MPVRHPDNLQNNRSSGARTVLVLGASGELGGAIARHYARHGARL